LGTASTGKRTAGRTTFGIGAPMFGGLNIAFAEAVARVA
jgi:hypothetical protein